MDPIVKKITPEEATGEVKELYEKMVKSSGSVPKWMQVMASNPHVLMGFFSLFKSVMDDAPADPQLKWKVAYHVSKINQCAFCIGVAENKLKPFGITPEQLEKLDDILNDKEKIAIKYAENVTNHAYKIEQSLYDDLKANFSDEEIVEITSAISLFNYINRFNDALKVLPE